MGSLADPQTVAAMLVVLALLASVFVLLWRAVERADDTGGAGDEGTAIERGDSGGSGDGPERRWTLGWLLRATLTAVGVGLVGLALVVLFRPALLPLDRLALPAVTETFREEALRMLAAVAVAGGLAIYLSRHVLGLGRADARSRATEPLPYPPELARAPPSDRAGAAIDEQIAAIGTGEWEPERVETALTETAVECLVTYGGHDEATARTRLESGAWTDDPRAAAYLGGADAQTPSWRVELWDWLRPMPRAERHVRHAVDALEAYARDHRGGEAGG